MTEQAYFDSALPIFAKLVEQSWKGGLTKSFFLRDVSGKLTLIIKPNDIDAETRNTLASKASELLGHYADDDGFAVATAEELFDEHLAHPAGIVEIDLQDDIYTGVVRLLDRRMVGADWLRTPVAAVTHPPRIAFASIKGGVGRSTALCVLAAELSSEGRRVLAIDMDLEAPGLGNMLLPGETLPRFGLLDYHVERGLGDVDDLFIQDMVASSWLSHNGGQVDVVPAIGRSSINHPANVLAKLARAYLAGIGLDGQTEGFSDHMSNALVRLTAQRRYDVVLIDARAGLHETSAAAIVGLGAEVLLFGVDQPQTYAGYDLLFAHLGTLPNTDDDWRSRLRFVHAKASLDRSSLSRFSESVERVFTKNLGGISDPLSKDVDVGDLTDEFAVIWDQDAEVQLPLGETNTRIPITIPDDSRFASFDPLSDRQVLARDIYRSTYGNFLAECKAIIDKGSLEGEPSR